MLKSNNKIYICSNFTTNFKPQIIKKTNTLNNFKKQKQILCKNFLIYLLLIKYKNSLFDISNIFIKKYKKKVYTILRSPYRHKLARHQININRYNIYSVLNIKTNDLIFLNWTKLLKFIKFVKKINKIFESNILFINNIKISTPFIFNKNFIIKNF